MHQTRFRKTHLVLSLTFALQPLAYAVSPSNDVSITPGSSSNNILLNDSTSNPQLEVKGSGGVFIPGATGGTAASGLCLDSTQQVITCDTTGPTGPTGPTGATGPKGATGPTGPAGISNYIIETCSDGPHSGTASCDAVCPDSTYKVLGGGADVSGTYLRDNYPTTSGGSAAWHVTGIGAFVGSSVTVTGYAICATVQTPP